MILLSTAVWSALAGIVTGMLVGWAVGRLLHTPQLDKLQSRRLAAATRVFAADGSEVAAFATERRIELRPEEIPDHLRRAIVAAEDNTFYRHGGVEPRAVLRAVVGSIVTMRLGGWGGGSTITQQLALNLFLQREISLSRKLREGLLAIDMEKRYSKAQILTMYANLIPLGRGAWGVEAASRLYFNRSARDLTLSQAALLAAMIPSPEGKFSPMLNPDNALRRRNRVLERMFERGDVTAEAYQAAAAEPLGAAIHRQANPTGDYLLERTRQLIAEEYSDDALYSGGMSVQVTMDPVLQEAAETAVREGLVSLDMRLGFRQPVNVLEEGLVTAVEEYQDPSWYRRVLRPNDMIRAVVTEVGANQARLRIGARVAVLHRAGAAWTGVRIMSRLLTVGDRILVRLPEDLQEMSASGPAAEERTAAALPVTLVQEPELEGALVAIDNRSGAVLAMVGGFDFKRSEFNRADQAVRQCGSTFKPFVALTAFEQGFTPTDILLDAPMLLSEGGSEPTYCPKNFYPHYYGLTTIRRAIEQSYNASAVKLQQLVGAQAVIDTARRFGISTDLQPYPSLALGSMGVRLIELVRAYAGIANLGELPEPYLIERVSDRDGRLLYQAFPQTEQAMAPAVAYLMLHVLRGVVERGTAQSLAGLDLQLAGKTGTTDSYTDAWFVGSSPRITAGVWVGRELNQPIGPHMSGGVAALPIFKQFIEAYSATLTDEQRAERFSVPPGVVHADIDWYTGRRATPQCEPVVREAFLSGTEPVASCDEELHSMVELPWPFQLPSYQPRRGEPMPSPEAIEVADRRLAPSLAGG